MTAAGSLSTKDYLRRMHGSAVYNVASRTPLDEAPLLSARLKNRVLLKREDLQPVFSFKLRGAYSLMARLDGATLERGVVAASAGNHAQGVALAARRLGATATIVVPRTTPSIKRQAITNLGAKLVVQGDTYDDAYHYALDLANSEGLFFVHAYDHPDVIAGQGTIGLELLDQAPEADAIFVPVGGGGLLAGVAMAVKSASPRIKVYGVEPEDADAMTLSIREGKRVVLPRVGVFADGVAVRQVGEETFRICSNPSLVDGMIVVSNDSICGAIKEVYEQTRTILEPAGALAFAGMREWVEESGRYHLNLVAICSGANMNFDLLRHVSERADVGERLEAILAVRIAERPGAFRSLCNALGNRSITEFNYRMGDATDAVVFVGVGIGSSVERQRILDHLGAEGMIATDLTDNEVAKSHLRHMVGGRSANATHERLFLFDFPERSGALAHFLDAIAGQWNISLFHYRNLGGDIGRVLAGIQLPPDTAPAFERCLADIGYDSTEVTDDPAVAAFLKPI